jgi:MFS family permease
MNSLIGARLLQGIGAAGRQSVGVIIVLDLTTPDTRGLWLGFFNLASAVGLAVGPVLGAVLSVDTSWRWIFWITLILIGLTLIIGSFSLRYPVPHRQQRVGLLAQLQEVDYVGCVLAVAISSMICIAIEMGNKLFPWNVSSWIQRSTHSSIYSSVCTYNRHVHYRRVSHPCVRLLRTQSG